MLPEGWDIKQLGEIAHITSGGTPGRDKPSYWNGSVPWIRTTEVQNCMLYESNVQEYISEEGLKNSSAKLFPKNTILLAMIGQGKTRGQVALLKFQATTNQNCAAIILNENQEPEFYYNFLLTQYKNIRSFSNSAGQSNLTGALVRSIKVPVPPLFEQRKIAKILSTWDRAIKVTEKLLSNSQQQKKTLMQQLLTGKKRFPGFSDKWTKVALGSVLEEIKRDKLENPTIYELLTVKLHLKGVVRSGKFPNSTEGGRPYYTRNAGELIIGRQNLHNGGIAIVPIEADGCIASNAISSFKAKNSELKFLLYLMSTNHFLFVVDNVVSGTGQKEISVKELLKLKIIVPKLEEQKRIASALSTADKEIEALQQKLNCLKQEKKALMQQLLTGKRRVKVDEEEISQKEAARA